jgi:hypothetical protein
MPRKMSRNCELPLKRLQARIEIHVNHKAGVFLERLLQPRHCIAGFPESRQWEARWADTRIHGTTKRRVAVMSDS